MPNNFNPFSMFEEMFGDNMGGSGGFHFNMGGMNQKDKIIQLKLRD